MNFKLSCTVLLVSAVFVAACAPLPVETGVIPNTGNPATQAIAVTKTPTTESTLPIPTVTPIQAEIATPTFLPAPDETLLVNREGSNPYLVDDQGRSLYVYLNDQQHSGASACLDDCAVEWPPLTVAAPPAAGDGVDALLAGAISREDGSLQATYNGWPLYYYLMDTVPGTTNGPNLESLWFLLSPSGEPIGR